MKLVEGKPPPAHPRLRLAFKCNLTCQSLALCKWMLGLSSIYSGILRRNLFFFKDFHSSLHVSQSIWKKVKINSMKYWAKPLLHCVIVRLLFIRVVLKVNILRNTQKMHFKVKFTNNDIMPYVGSVWNGMTGNAKSVVLRTLDTYVV